MFSKSATRQGFAAAAALSAVIGLSACGTDDVDTAQAADSSSSSVSVPKPAADVALEAWHAQLLDKVIADQPLPPDALAALQRERGSVVREQLVKAALPEARIALGKPQQATGAQEGDIATRLELAPL